MRVTDELMTVEDVARELGVSHDDAMRLIRSGDLVGTIYRPEDGTFLVPRKVFEAYRQTRS